MTTARNILASGTAGADYAAQELAEDIEQDWEHESTLYTFADGSVLIASGPQLTAYDDIYAARAALEA